MQKITHFIIFFWLIACGRPAFGQHAYQAKITVKAIPDTCSFPGHWAYSWDIFKNDDGTFSSALSDTIQPGDTAHLYFSADCNTNIQGGYDIRYCYAIKAGNAITINFADGLPAYASTFTIYIHKDSFYFKPHISYPARGAFQIFAGNFS